MEKKNKVETEGGVLEFDSQGRLTYSRDSDGNERWIEYTDDGGHTARYAYGGDRKLYHVYDSSGNLIYSKTIDGIEEWFEYDEKGRNIHAKNTIGFEYWYKYEDDKIKIQFIDSNGNSHYRETDDPKVIAEKAIKKLYGKAAETDGKNGKI